MINFPWLAAYLKDMRMEAQTRLAPVVRRFKDRHPEEKVEAVIVETAAGPGP